MSNDYPRLLSLVVHELRTPLSVVSGYLRMLQRDDATLSDRQRTMIEEADKSSERLAAIVDELSEISKLDAALVTLERRPLDLFALVADVAGHVHEASDRDVRLVVRGDTAGAPMTGDAVRLRTAFAAVLRAILREKPGPATVVVACRRELRNGQPTAIIVIAEESGLQEAGARAADPFDENRGGLGLQLPLARRAFESHGGRLSQPAASPAAATNDPLAKGSAIVSMPLTA